MSPSVLSVVVPDKSQSRIEGRRQSPSRCPSGPEFEERLTLERHRGSYVDTGYRGLCPSMLRNLPPDPRVGISESVRQRHARFPVQQSAEPGRIAIPPSDTLRSVEMVNLLEPLPRDRADQVHQSVGGNDFVGP